MATKYQPGAATPPPHPRTDSFSAESAALIDVSSVDAQFDPIPARGFYVGTTGNVNVITVRGDTVLFTAVQAGEIVPISITAILHANTTASTIVALW